MNLVSIIPHLIAGENVRRYAWRHDSRYLFRITSATDGETVTVMYNNDAVSTYHISNRDAWADDWEVLP